MQERLSAVSAIETGVASLGEVGEKSLIHGRYKAQCFEVEPEHRKEYDALHARIIAAQKRSVFRKFIDLLLFRPSLADMGDALKKFPMRLKWENEFDNVVCTAGKNDMLDDWSSASGYTQVGPYMGLISSVSWSATAAGDTMSSHSGWTEAGSTNAPTFAARGTPSWSSASAGIKSTSSAVSFTMTGSGTLEGAFLVLGSGAVTTLMSTAGTLFSAGAFSGGAQAVSSGNVVTVSYSLSI